MSVSARVLGLCVCAWLFVLSCVSISKTWPQYRLKGSGKNNGSRSLHFPYISPPCHLFVTPQQINSRLILISQEITYLLSLIPLLFIFLFAHNRTFSHSSWHFLYFLLLCASEQQTCMPTHTHTHTHALMHSKIRRHTPICKLKHQHTIRRLLPLLHRHPNP